jgi:hypothetical protein
VKDSPFSPFLPLWCFFRRSLSLPCYRFAPSTPSGAAPRSRRSAARPACRCFRPANLPRGYLR